MTVIFEYSEYRAFLNDFIKAQPNGGHGLRSRMADAIGCQLAYLSQVLHEKAHLSLDQVVKLNTILRLGKEELRFLLLLLQHSRAGTTELMKIFEDQIQEILKKRQRVTNRIEPTDTLLLEQQAEYYRHWWYSAVHMLLTIPTLNTRDSIAAYLGLAAGQAEEILNFLVKAGLAIEKNGCFSVGKSNLHVPRESPMASRHLANWRLRAMEAIGSRRDEDFFYTSAVTFAERDIKKLRECFVKAAENSRKVVSESPSETAFVINIDFFKM